MARTSKKGKEENAHKNVVAMGGNITGLMESIAKTRDNIIQWKKDRAEINAKIKEARESMEAKGITKRAFDLALGYFEAAPEQRDGFDTAYHLAREGMGLPVRGEQLDIFIDKANAVEATATEEMSTQADF